MSQQQPENAFFTPFVGAAGSPGFSNFSEASVCWHEMSHGTIEAPGLLAPADQQLLAGLLHEHRSHVLGGILELRTLPAATTRGLPGRYRRRLAELLGNFDRNGDFTIFEEIDFETLLVATRRLSQRQRLEG